MKCFGAAQKEIGWLNIKESETTLLNVEFYSLSKKKKNLTEKFEFKNGMHVAHYQRFFA